MSNTKANAHSIRPESFALEISIQRLMTEARDGEMHISCRISEKLPSWHRDTIPWDFGILDA